MLSARHHMVNAGFNHAQQLEVAQEPNDEEEETPGGCILAHSMVRAGQQAEAVLLLYVTFLITVCRGSASAGLLLLLC